MKKLTKILWVVGVAFLLSNFASFGPASKADNGNSISSAAEDQPVMVLAAKKGRKGKPSRRR